MNRKKFLSTLAGAGFLLPAYGTGKRLSDWSPIIPPYLQKGDTIGICSPAGHISLGDIQPAIQQIEAWGFRVKPGSSIGQKYFNFGGSDVERRNDLQSMLDDSSLKAILCARGGYGIVRLIDELNFEGFLRSPKWVVGFSDVTILHCHLSRLGVASIHSKMCNSFPKSWSGADQLQKDTIFSIASALKGEKVRYPLAASDCNKTGIGEGILVGGNLKLIESMAGTKSDIDTRDKILFIEDAGEYLYSIDRMMMNLKRTGKLEALKGLIVGGFRVKPDDPGEEFGIVLEDIILDKVKEYNYPVCFGFPVGHQKNNFALKCGVKHRLEVQKGICKFEEI